MPKIKISLESIALVLFFWFILFFGPGTIFDHKIKHDFPFGYFASDAFQHQVRAEAIKDYGNFRHEAPYISKGFENVVGRYPPVIYHLVVVLSWASGMETYDSIYFVVVLFSILASFAAYLLIKKFNPIVALLSLPLSLLIFSQPVSTGILWGHWPSILSQCFLIFLFWAVMRLELKYSYVLIALALSATTLTHTSETIFGLIFLAIFFGIRALSKELGKNDIKTMLMAALLFFAITFYYMVIFMNTWRNQGYSFLVQPVWEGNPGFYIAGFGLILLPIVLGLSVALLKIKSLHVAVIGGAAMLISGFLNYAGFELRSFQIRFFWPIYLSVFFGLGIYVSLKFAIKRWNTAKAAVIFFIFLILLSGSLQKISKNKISLPEIKRTAHQVIPSIPSISFKTSQGIMNSVHWQALKWLSGTERGSRIYFFYGDIYSQDALLRNSKRIHYQVDPDDFVKALQERKIKRFYVSELPGDSGGGIKARKSFFVMEPVDATKPYAYFFGPQDICSFDYLVFDKVSGNSILAQYNLLIASELIKKDYIEPKFENEFVVILKNNNKGEDCIEEKSF